MVNGVGVVLKLPGGIGCCLLSSDDFAVVVDSLFNDDLQGDSELK